MWEGVAKSNSFEVKHAHRLNEFSLRLPLLVENTTEEITRNPLLLEAHLSELWYIGLLVVRPLGQELLPELPVEALGQVTDPGQPPVNISQRPARTLSPDVEAERVGDGVSQAAVQLDDGRQGVRLTGIGSTVLTNCVGTMGDQYGPEDGDRLV